MKEATQRKDEIWVDACGRHSVRYFIGGGYSNYTFQAIVAGFESPGGLDGGRIHMLYIQRVVRANRRDRRISTYAYEWQHLWHSDSADEKD